MFRGPQLTRPPAGTPPKAQPARGDGWSLGCGALLLVALLVLIFRAHRIEDLTREVQGLRGEVNELRTAVDAQASQIKALQDKLDRAKPRVPQSVPIRPVPQSERR